MILQAVPGIAQPVPAPSLPWWQQPLLQQPDAFSFTSNQALLAAQQDTKAGAAYINRYFIKGLYQFAGAVSFRAAGGGAGFSVMHLGYTGFANTQVGAAYGKKLSRWVDIGLQFNMHRMMLSGFGAHTLPGFEIGIVLHPTESLLASVQLRNRVTLRQNAKPAAFYCSQLGYSASSVFFVVAALVKEEDTPADTRIQLLYLPSPLLFTSVGYSSRRNAFSLGIGLQWQRYGLRIYSSFEQMTGMCSGLQFLFSSSDVQNKAQ
jgi:hypothetical protein